MKRVNQIVAIILLFCLIAGLSACAKADIGDKNTKQKINKYIKTSFPIPNDNYIISNVCTNNSVISIFGYEVTDEPNNYYIYTTGLDGKVIRQIRCAWDDNYAHSIMASDVDSDGTIWLLEYLWEYKYDSNGVKTEENLAKWIVETIDESGFSGAIISSDEIFEPMDITVNDEKIYLFDSSSCAAFSYDGAKLWYDESLNGIYRPCFSSDGKLYVCGNSAEGEVLNTINPLDCSVEKSAKLEIDIFDIITGIDYDLYISNGISLYGYNAGSGQLTEVLNWVSAGVTGDYKGVIAMEDGSFLYYTSREICYLRTAIVESGETTVLTLGTMDSTFLKNYVIDFNASNYYYEVQITDYSQYNTAENPNGGLTRLNLDIVSGNAPDIIDLSSLPRDQFEKAGLLEDLYPFIKSDNSLSKTEFVSPVIKALETDGQLFTLVPCYTIMLLEGHRDKIDTRSVLNFSDLLALKDSMGEGENPFGLTMSKKAFIETMMSVSNSKYVDWETKKCNFDDFAALLEFAATLPDEYDLSHDLQMINSGEQLLSLQYVGSYVDLVAFNYYFDYDLGLYGIPSAKSSGAIICPYITLAISSGSTNKTGAWEFLRMFLLDDNQKIFSEMMLTITEYGMDCSKDLIKQWQTSDGLLYLNDINGNQVAIDSNAKDCEVLFEDMIQSVTGVYNFNQALFDIVWSEAQAFFCGDKSAEEVTSIIQSKVSLYVAEQG